MASKKFVGIAMVILTIDEIIRILQLSRKVAMFKAILYIKRFEEGKREKPFLVLFGLVLLLTVIAFVILSVLPGMTIVGAAGLAFIFFILLFMDYEEVWANSQWLCREVVKIDDFTLNGM